MGRKRNNRIAVMLDNNELKILNNKLKKTSLSLSEFIRKLILEKKIQEKPDEEFYILMNKLLQFENVLNQIYEKSYYLNEIDSDYYKDEAKRWREFITLIKARYL